jgi:glycosyltransferase
MNKGFKMSSGDIVGTLNADDYYADNQVLERVAKVMADTRIDACYGDLVFVQSHRDQFEDRIVRFWRAGNQGQVWSADTSSRSVFSNPWLWGWMPPHPTLFIRRHILETLGVFRLDMGTAADFELMLRLLNKHRIRCAYIPEVLVKMRVGGVSTRSITNRLKAHLNDWKAWRINGLIPFPWTVPLKPLRKIGQWTSD